ncbi:exosome 3'-_5 exonuclease subunit ski4 (Csl4) [Emydomyces testavorans]|uniref:Exosome 3'->5 exonuclease subunit ski4 (Csl4) n=1 Tax=Emydomyces testavorans TaxID=2070801 RepID=A0AAF0DNR7_9EURO|nr:exosome 3'->5 exonuclease subunit ski4 (Csl4) [Emydomyces testavorans]
MATPPLPSIAVPGQQLADSLSYTSGPGTYIRDNSICASIPGSVIVRRDAHADPKGPRSKILTIARSHEPSATSSHNNNNNNNINNTLPQKTGLTLLGSTNKPAPLRFNTTLPTVGSIVLGRVTRVQKRQATISILIVLPPQTLTTLDPVCSSSSSSDDDTDLPAILASASTSTTADFLNADELRPQALIRKEDVRAVEKDRVVMEESFRVGDIVRAVVVSVGDQAAYYASTAGNELGVVMARSSSVVEGDGEREGGGGQGLGGNMMFPGDEGSGDGEGGDEEGCEAVLRGAFLGKGVFARAVDDICLLEGLTAAFRTAAWKSG